MKYCTITLLMLMFTASVAACECEWVDCIGCNSLQLHSDDCLRLTRLEESSTFRDRCDSVRVVIASNVNEIYDSVWLDRPDTARYYAKVDTVIEFTVRKICGATYEKLTIDTTWLPKVQVWLTPAEIEKLRELVK